MPANVAAGWYFLDIRSGTAIGSTLLETQYGYWTGTAFVLGAADVRQINGVDTDGTPAVGSRPVLYLDRLDLHNDDAVNAALSCVNDNALGMGFYQYGGLIGCYQSSLHTACIQDGGDCGCYQNGGDYGCYQSGGIADVYLGGTGSIRSATISIATTTGNWSTPGTWASGIVPAAGDNIIIRTGVTVTIAADLDLEQFGTLTLEGSGRLSTNATVAVVPPGWTIWINYATITTNYGMILGNRGTVTTNEGTVRQNDEIVVNNYGTVLINCDTVSQNSIGGVVYNYSGGTVVNAGGVVYNYSTAGSVTGTGTVILDPAAALTAYNTTGVAKEATALTAADKATAIDTLTKAGGPGDLAAILADTGTDGVKVASIAADAIDAASVKADAVTKLQAGLAMATNLAAVKTDTTDLPGLIQAATGGGKQFNAKALALAPHATVVVNVTPGYVGPASMGAVTTGNWEAWQNSAFSITFPLLDSAGDPITVTGQDLTCTFYDANDPETIVISAATDGDDALITIGGTDGNTITIVLAATLLTMVGTLAWVLRMTDDSMPLADGNLRIKSAPPIIATP
jgi:hypothetical protein